MDQKNFWICKEKSLMKASYRVFKSLITVSALSAVIGALSIAEASTCSVTLKKYDEKIIQQTLDPVTRPYFQARIPKGWKAGCQATTHA